MAILTLDTYTQVLTRILSAAAFCDACRSRACASCERVLVFIRSTCLQDKCMYFQNLGPTQNVDKMRRHVLGRSLKNRLRVRRVQDSCMHADTFFEYTHAHIHTCERARFARAEDPMDSSLLCAVGANTVTPFISTRFPAES
jgi:hypothetical protein